MADDTSTTPTDATAPAGDQSAPKHAEQGVNTGTVGEHDRVQMLSLRADGTPDQTNPEIIGDPEVALAVAKEQFKQQAVSAVDVQLRSAPAPTVDEDAPQDPTVAALQEAHEQAAAAGEAAAEKAIKGLSS